MRIGTDGNGASTGETGGVGEGGISDGGCDVGVGEWGDGVGECGDDVGDRGDAVGDRGGVLVGREGRHLGLCRSQRRSTTAGVHVASGWL